MANIDTEELEKLPTIITDVENPEVYSKDINHINKPIKNIKFGHLLNINWDNLAGAFTLIKKFLAEVIYKQDVDNKNTAAKIVQRNLDKSIEVGDIYCSSVITPKVETIPEGVGIAFKHPETGGIEFTKDYEAFRKMTNTISKDDMNSVEQLDKDGSGSFTMWGGSRKITLKDSAKKYKVITAKAGGSQADVQFMLLLPGQLVKAREHDRNGGGEIHLIWDGATTITVSHYVHRDGRTGQVAGVWGVI